MFVQPISVGPAGEVTPLRLGGGTLAERGLSICAYPHFLSALIMRSVMATSGVILTPWRALPIVPLC